VLAITVSAIVLHLTFAFVISVLFYREISAIVTTKALHEFSLVLSDECTL